MGFLTPVDRGLRARRDGVGHRHPPCGLCADELGAVRSDSNLPDNRHSKLLEVEAQGRQLNILAQLVRSIDPEEAENLAGKLIQEFGSLGQVFAASSRKISQLTGNERLAAVLSSSRAAVLEGMREEVSRLPINPRDPRLMKYLIAQMQGEEEEHLHAIFLDSQRRYIRDERIASGDWSNVTVRMRPLFRRTIDLRSASLILFHNHPSGKAEPSAADIDFTSKVQNVARSLGTELLDHLIVAGASVFSMRTAGLMT